MSFEPFPAGAAHDPAAPGRPRPRTVAIAVKVMYAGAALQALGLVLSLVTAGGLRTAIRAQYPHFTAAQVHSAEVTAVVSVVLVGVVGIGLWVWMALANGNGQRYARVVASVLFVAYTADILFSLSRTQVVVGFVFSMLTWLIGLAATLLLWRRESTAFYGQAQSS